MKAIKTSAAQGDLIVRRVPTLPTGLKREKPQPSGVIVAHSETGHHHVATVEAGDLVHYTSDDVLRSFIVAPPGQDVTITHQRAWDTHEALKLLGDEQGGEVIWEIRRQREYTPEGWRRVED